MQSRRVPTVPAGRIPGQLAAVLIEDCVALARATRDHRQVRNGSSIRGAMDVAATTAVLLAAAGVRAAGSDGGRRDPDYADAVLHGTCHRSTTHGGSQMELADTVVIVRRR